MSNRALLITFFVIATTLLGASCEDQRLPEMTEVAGPDIPVFVGLKEIENSPDPCDDAEPVAAPSSKSFFNGVDFANFSYPNIFDSGSFRLHRGCFSETESMSFTRFDLDAVRFFDADRDGRTDALVTVRGFSCGASCGGWLNYYFFRDRGDGRPSLEWKLVGGERHDCPPLDSVFENDQLTVTVLNECQVGSPGLSPDQVFRSEGSSTTDGIATIFKFGWNGRRFVQLERVVGPNVSTRSEGLQTLR